MIDALLGIVKPLLVLGSVAALAGLIAACYSVPESEDEE